MVQRQGDPADAHHVGDGAGYVPSYVMGRRLRRGRCKARPTCSLPRADRSGAGRKLRDSREEERVRGDGGSGRVADGKQTLGEMKNRQQRMPC